MLPIRTLLVALAILATPVPALAGPSALEVTPPDTVFAMAFRGLGQLQPLLDEHGERMVELGLEDPGMDRLWKFLRKELSGLRLRRGPLAPALGLAPEGAIAFYFTKIDDEDLGVIVLDVSDRSALIRTLTWLMEEASHPPTGEKAKVRVKRTKLPSGGLDVEFTSEHGSDPLYARFQGSIVALSDAPAALQRVPFGGGAHYPGMEVLAAPEARFGFFLGVSLETGVRVGIFPAPAMTVPWVRYHGVMGATTFSAELVAEIAPDMDPYMAILKPGARGAKARTAMAGLVSGLSDVWGRFSYDLEGIQTLAKNLLGGGFKEIEDGFEENTALELKSVVSAFTGDHLLRCDGSLSTCIFAMGVGDREAASEVFRHLFAAAGDAITKESGVDVTVDTRVSATPRRGHRRFTTTFSILIDLDADLHEASPSDGPAKKRRRKTKWKASDLRPVYALHWGLSNDLVVFGATPQAIDAALGVASAAPPVSPAAEGLVGDDLSLIAGYQAAGEVGDLIRQFLPVLRGILPAKFEAGVAVRIIDGLVMSHDHLVDAASFLRIDGSRVTLRGVSHALPGVGDPGYVEQVSKAYDAALRARYSGDIAQSNRLMARLAFDHGDTPWGRKADNFAFVTEGLGTIVYAAYLAAMLDSSGSERMMEDLMQEIFGIDIGDSAPVEKPSPHPAHDGH
jgi:hypothetical protein